jgi:hypothetical protein
VLPRFPQSTFIADTFAGSTLTRVTCHACGRPSDRVENFNVLSLDLEPALAAVQAGAVPFVPDPPQLQQEGGALARREGAEGDGARATPAAGGANHTSGSGSDGSGSDGEGGRRPRKRSGSRGGSRGGVGSDAPRASPAVALPAVAGNATAQAVAASAHSSCAAASHIASAGGSSRGAGRTPAAAGAVPVLPATPKLSLSLGTCLRLLSAGELLAGDSAYHCDACDRKVTATRRLRLHKLPPALLIHVNRAQWNLRAGGRKEKLQAHLPFPFTLSPGDLAGLGVLSEDATASYCNPAAASRSAEGLAREAGGRAPARGASAMDVHADTDTDSGNDSASDVEVVGAAAAQSVDAGVDADWHYRLQALVVHQGKGIDTGHYTAFGYENERDAWVLFDDHRVSVALPAEVARGQAYLLCYERTEGRAPSERGLQT